MHETMELMERACKMLSKALKKELDAIEDHGGNVPAEDAQYTDHLLHGIKSAKATMKMEGSGYSERRDSMGRYTSREGGGTYADDERSRVREMMESTRDERVRRALESAYRMM